MSARAGAGPSPSHATRGSLPLPACARACTHLVRGIDSPRYWRIPAPVWVGDSVANALSVGGVRWGRNSVGLGTLALKKGAALLERMVHAGTVCLRRLADGKRPYEVQFNRFLANCKVTVERLVTGWGERTSAAAVGRHVLAIQSLPRRRPGTPARSISARHAVAPAAGVKSARGWAAVCCGMPWLRSMPRARRAWAWLPAWFPAWSPAWSPAGYSCAGTSSL
jgi:hypothetical protein